MDIVGRFWSKVDKTGDCWLWKAAHTSAGYGMFSVKHQLIYAHRMAYELLNGSIPKDMHVLHSCDNRSCVNPSHLFLGKDQDNVNDMIKKNRHSHGHRHPGSLLTEDNVREIIKLYMDGITGHALAERYNVTPSSIWSIVSGRNWKHIMKELANA